MVSKLNLNIFSLIYKSNKSPYLECLCFRKVKTSKHDCRCSAELSSSSLHLQENRLSGRDYLATGSRSAGRVGELAWRQRRGDRLTGRRTELDWALLEGFFASPSLNESNP